MASRTSSVLASTAAVTAAARSSVPVTWANTSVCSSQREVNIG